MFIIIFSCSPCRGEKEPGGLFLLKKNGLHDTYRVTDEQKSTKKVMNVLYIACIVAISKFNFRIYSF